MVNCKDFFILWLSRVILKIVEPPNAKFIRNLERISIKNGEPKIHRSFNESYLYNNDSNKIFEKNICLVKLHKLCYVFYHDRIIHICDAI